MSKKKPVVEMEDEAEPILYDVKIAYDDGGGHWENGVTYKELPIGVPLEKDIPRRGWTPWREGPMISVRVRRSKDQY